MHEFNSVTGCATALVVAILPIRLAYLWLLPKPIPGVPHNPITSILGDIPKITRVTEEKTFEEYIADEAREHGSLFQVSILHSLFYRIRLVRYVEKHFASNFIHPRSFLGDIPWL